MSMLLSSYAVGGAGQRGRCEKTCSSRKTFPISDIEEYYSSAKNLQGLKLKSELNSIIKGHKAYGYDCVWTALTETDADPDDKTKSNVTTLYSRKSVVDILERIGNECLENKFAPELWNREHVWSVSHGFKEEENAHAWTDIHHLFPSQYDINNDRADRDSIQIIGKIAENKILSVADIKCDGCFKEEETREEGFFESPKVVKGQIARVMFYMDTRYEGDDSSTTNTGDLKLVDRKTNSSKKFGVLSDLLKWHCEHEVDPRERERNDIVQQWQGNRNPFIDKPEFVQAIWGEEFPEAFVMCNKTNKTNPEPGSMNCTM